MPRRSCRAAKAGTILPPNELRLGLAPLHESLQASTALLVEWLGQDYHLSDNQVRCSSARS